MKNSIFKDVCKFDLKILKQYILGQKKCMGKVTLVPEYCLDSLEIIVDEIIKNEIPGDFVEAGVLAGGVCLYLAALLHNNKLKNKKIWLVDSFIGFPEEKDLQFGRVLEDDGEVGLHSIVKAESEKLFEYFDLYDENIIKYLPGFFKDTIGPNAKNCSIEKISLLRLDGDLYSSTRETLEGLYDKVSIGGFVVVDDMVLLGCNKATKEFIKKRNITGDFYSPLLTGSLYEMGDTQACYWRKSS